MEFPKSVKLTKIAINREKRAIFNEISVRKNKNIKKYRKVTKSVKNRLNYDK